MGFSPAAFWRPSTSLSEGFGFIQPEDRSDDVFVHQTEIFSDGFRYLADGELIEFETQTEESGRNKAVCVTGPEGAAVQGAPFKPQNDYEY